MHIQSVSSTEPPVIMLRFAGGGGGGGTWDSGCGSSTERFRARDLKSRRPYALSISTPGKLEKNLCRLYPKMDGKGLFPSYTQR